MYAVEQGKGRYSFASIKQSEHKLLRVIGQVESYRATLSARLILLRVQDLFLSHRHQHNFVLSSCCIDSKGLVLFRLVLASHTLALDLVDSCQ